MATKNGYILEASGNTIPLIDSGSLRREETAVHALDSNKLGGKAPEYYIQPRNLLDNSDFTNPVNQRGVGNGTVNAWKCFIDRWQPADNALNVSLNNNGIYLNASSNAWLCQQVQLSAADAGKTYTLAFGLADGTIISASGTYPGGSNWMEFIKKTTDKYEIRAGQIENYKIRCEILPKTAITVSWTALYEGIYTEETLPPYIPKGYGVELGECMRYYYRNWDGSIAPANAKVITAVSSKHIESMAYPVPMRITPTITLYNPFTKTVFPQFRQDTGING